MSSAWGSSWGSAWGNSWGSVTTPTPPPPPQVESGGPVAFAAGPALRRLSPEELKALIQTDGRADGATIELKPAAVHAGAGSGHATASGAESYVTNECLAPDAAGSASIEGAASTVPVMFDRAAEGAGSATVPGATVRYGRALAYDEAFLLGGS